MKKIADLEKSLTGLWVLQDTLTNDEKYDKIIELSQDFANAMGIGCTYRIRWAADIIVVTFLQNPDSYTGEHCVGDDVIYRHFAKCEYKQFQIDINQVEDLAAGLSKIFVDCAVNLVGLKDFALKFDKCKPLRYIDTDIASMYPTHPEWLQKHFHLPSRPKYMTDYERQRINEIFGRPSTSGVPAIKNVIFNEPATIVFWEDGTKTVVKAQDERFDPEKGLAMAISKKALGNKRDYYHTFLHWFKKYMKDELRKIDDIDEMRDVPHAHAVYEAIVQGCSKEPDSVEVFFESTDGESGTLEYPYIQVEEEEPSVEKILERADVEIFVDDVLRTRTVISKSDKPLTEDEKAMLKRMWENQGDRLHVVFKEA